MKRLFLLFALIGFTATAQQNQKEKYYVISESQLIHIRKTLGVMPFDQVYQSIRICEQVMLQGATLQDMPADSSDKEQKKKP